MTALDLFSLHGKRAAVTGASQGIGQALAIGLAEAGADVALIARREEALEEVAAEIRAMDRKAFVLPADVTHPREVEWAFGMIADGWGTLDILVNNAGTNIRRPLLETADEEWDQILRTNLGSAFYCARAAARLMVEGQAGGRLIFIGSVAGIVALPTGVAYAASKAALAQMARTLALELGPHGITANCVAPWYFRTPLTAGVLGDPRYVDAILQATPLGRLGEMQDLVGPVVWLASPAGGYVTGQTIAVDGGMTVRGF